MTTARLNMRVQPETLQRIREAATSQGMDVTSFVIEAATSRARQIAIEERVLHLSPAEMAQVSALLSADREPSPALVKAARRLARLEAGA